MHINVPENIEIAISRIDGFYFTTRNPGDDSFIPTEKDIDLSKNAVELTRKFTLEKIQKLENIINDQDDTSDLTFGLLNFNDL